MSERITDEREIVDGHEISKCIPSIVVSLNCSVHTPIKNSTRIFSSRSRKEKRLIELSETAEEKNIRIVCFSKLQQDR